MAPGSGDLVRGQVEEDVAQAHLIQGLLVVAVAVVRAVGPDLEARGQVQQHPRLGRHLLIFRSVLVEIAPQVARGVHHVPEAEVEAASGRAVGHVTAVGVDHESGRCSIVFRPVLRGKSISARRQAGLVRACAGGADIELHVTGAGHGNERVVGEHPGARAVPDRKVAARGSKGSSQRRENDQAGTRSRDARARRGARLNQPQLERDRAGLRLRPAGPGQDREEKQEPAEFAHG